MRLKLVAAAIASFCFASSASAPSAAQSTDGYHQMQVIPLVVDSGSFASTIWLYNEFFGINFKWRYFPADGTSLKAQGPCTVENASVWEAETRALPWRNWCPSATGTQFGFAVLDMSVHGNVFSRVQNPEGLGFSVEGFPLSDFTSAGGRVIGLTRKAATATEPGYQSNCFLANMAELTPPAAPIAARIHYTVYDSKNGWPNMERRLGFGDVDLLPGQMIRLLDVFAAAGAPPGDYDRAVFAFEEFSPEEPGIMGFCTVQENTHYTADFRIAKQFVGEAGDTGADKFPNPYQGGNEGPELMTTPIAQDLTASRVTRASADGLGRNFTIPAGEFGNTHVAYFRHPDRVSCWLDSATTSETLDASYGLELRMLDANGSVVAGGNAVSGFSDLYMGDKAQRSNGANGRYFLEVESATSSESERPYAIACRSGSGHTLTDLVRYHEPVNRF